ncbi:hypothetical protein LO763_22420 [Glycomyces sp. A-F 0318]|uniref:hypothetical protein n=1 Tax=Glycomyces amatae TaxID=2881355 RepID=UPI001E47FED0|nr:hypothetical protein [Glycomyces amatae]MCD0446374.1 hypothetical protein [Glycomyces amatae]
MFSTDVDFAASEPDALAAITGRFLAPTDLHELNMLSANGRVHFIDRAWARPVAVWVDAEMVTMRLVAAGHTCEKANQWRLDQIPDLVPA